MARSAKRPEILPEPANPVVEAIQAVGGVVARNPAYAAGSTAFAVAMSFVSANALWYQPYTHPTAFFSTREVEHGDMPAAALSETTIKIERPDESAARKVEGDPVVKGVQVVLRSLNLYDGAVDGLTGPGTKRAVEAYQKTVGLPITGTIDDELLNQLDTKTTAAIPPKPAVKPAAKPELQMAQPVRFDGVDDSATGRIRKIQGGLRAFGRNDVDIDGKLGTRTREAIKEFQSLFGLKVTGEPTNELFAKMRSENLID
jgi:peptidoglycan hydrolase-like protein with peptidoglycan-binding domain